MSTFDSSISGFVKPIDTLTVTLYFAGLALLYYVGQTIYSVYFGPLSKFPGPALRAWSKIPQIASVVTGMDGVLIPELHRRYGPIVRIAPTEISLANGAQSWQDVYGFKKHGQTKPYKDRVFYTKPFNGVDGLITANDANHSRQRKIMSNAFSDKTLKEQGPMLKRWAEKMKTKLAERAATGENIDMLKYYNCTTFDIMAELTFSESLGMLEDSEYSPWVKTIFASIKSGALFRGIRLCNWVFKYVINEILMKSAVTQKKMAAHWGYTVERVDRRLKQTPETPDLWSKVLEKSEGSNALSVEEHYSIASLFMIAGTETTATALSGTTYHLLRNPQAMKKLSEEIRTAFSSFDDVNLESCAHQKYLMAVLQEGLRMYPPVPTTLPRRIPKGGMFLDGGKWVPEGTTIGVNHMAMYRSEAHFKHANEFHPERWLGDPEFKDDHLDALEPFSTGPRNCLGKNLAWHEMRLLLTTIAFHFDMKLCEESNDWSDQRVFTLWEKKPLICTLTTVNASFIGQ